MRKIGPIASAIVIASWVFGLGFAFGFESELVSNPALSSAQADAAATGVAVGAVAVAGAGIGAFGVWLAARRRRVPRVAPAR